MFKIDIHLYATIDDLCAVFCFFDAYLHPHVTENTACVFMKVIQIRYNKKKLSQRQYNVRATINVIAKPKYMERTPT